MWALTFSTTPLKTYFQVHLSPFVTCNTYGSFTWNSSFSLRLMLPVASGSAPQVATSSSCHVIVAPSSAVGRFLLQVRQPGTRCQTISGIRRLAKTKTLLGDCWRHTCLRCIRARSALEALRNALYKCSTYLLTYLLVTVLSPWAVKKKLFAHHCISNILRRQYVVCIYKCSSWHLSQCFHMMLINMTHLDMRSSPCFSFIIVHFSELNCQQLSNEQTELHFLVQLLPQPGTNGCSL